VSSVTARCVAKALWDNTSLTALDVSGCHLDDTSGTYLARMLKHNSSLVKLEMGSNKFGPRTCAALAQSLSVRTTSLHARSGAGPSARDEISFPRRKKGCSINVAVFYSIGVQVNKTLRHLDVQSNQLTRAGEDLEGMHALCDMLRKNTTLTYLNLWRCELGVQVRARLARG
jgi:Ran GTPase-activating protein (RanGAP) involved in mRNA processing and transport